MRLMLLGAFTLLLGAAVAVLGIGTYRDARASARWPAAPGVVVRSQVVRHAYRGRGPRTGWEADVRYRYTVTGRTYEGSTLAIGVDRTYGDERLAQGNVGQFPVGRAVPVYHDPRDPSRSALVRGSPAGRPGPWIAMLAALPLLGAGLLAVGWRSVRRRGGARRVVDAELFGGA